LERRRWGQWLGLCDPIEVLGGKKEREGVAAKGRTREGGCKTKRGTRGSARVLGGGGRVGSPPLDRDQRPKPALTSVLPTPAYKSNKILLFY
jgi:hypothetical protein